MRKLLTILFLFISASVFAQNTVTLETGTTSLPSGLTWRYKAVTPDSLNRLWALNQLTGKYNRIYTATEVNKLFSPTSLLHWTDTLTKIATKHDLLGITGLPYWPLTGSASFTGNVSIGTNTRSFTMSSTAGALRFAAGDTTSAFLGAQMGIASVYTGGFNINKNGIGIGRQFGALGLVNQGLYVGSNGHALVGNRMGFRDDFNHAGTQYFGRISVANMNDSTLVFKKYVDSVSNNSGLYWPLGGSASLNASTVINLSHKLFAAANFASDGSVLILNDPNTGTAGTNVSLLGYSDLSGNLAGLAIGKYYTSSNINMAIIDQVNHKGLTNDSVTISRSNYTTWSLIDKGYADSTAINDTTHLKSANYINAGDRGLSVSNTAAANTTILTNLVNSSNFSNVYLPNGTYLVTDTISNKLGHKFTGPGILVKTITGGQQQLNSYTDYQPYWQGVEYLGDCYYSRLLGRLANDISSIQIVYSGDSTTFGTGSSTGFHITDDMAKIAINQNIPFITTVNAGHSGQGTPQWLSTYIAADTVGTQLYVIRWGINDPTFGLSATQFINNLRQGLASIRAGKDVSKMSIIIMTPNATADTPTGRDEKWMESIIPGIRQAAKDYQCAFFDTYSFTKNARNSINRLDSLKIHPSNALNALIASELAKVVYPDYIRTGVLANPNSTIITSTTAPNLFVNSVTINRAPLASGWPISGQVTTINNGGNLWIQYLSNQTATFADLQYRVNASTTTWTPWVDVNGDAIVVGTDADITLINTPQLFRTPTTITANRTITLPTAASAKGVRMVLADRNALASSFSWSTSLNLVDQAGAGNPAMTNQSVYTIESDGSNWNIVSIQRIVPVKDGGTGVATIPVGALMVGNTTSPITTVAAVATGSILTSNGTGVAPVYSTALPNGVTATTQTAGDNSTKVATTAYVDANRRVVSTITGATTIPTLTALSDYTYIANNTTQVVLTLSALCSVGARIQLNGLGTGGWKIAQNAGDVIKTTGGTTTTGTGGNITSSNQYNSITITCIVANTGSGGTYIINYSQGSPTLN